MLPYQPSPFSQLSRLIKFWDRFWLITAIQVWISTWHRGHDFQHLERYPQSKWSNFLWSLNHVYQTSNQMSNVCTNSKQPSWLWKQFPDHHDHYNHNYSFHQNSHIHDNQRNCLLIFFQGGLVQKKRLSCETGKSFFNIRNHHHRHHSRYIIIIIIIIIKTTVHHHYIELWNDKRFLKGKYLL